ncbi:MAG: FMN-binding protein [Verrucomicrobia bacterium]|nr:FMN-binding protein [Verrucomicrobiota bacterium]
MRALRSSCLLLLFLWIIPIVHAADQIEFLNGAKLSGRVISIHKESRQVEFEAEVAGKKQSRRYPYSRVHVVVWNGKRYVVSKKSQPVSSSPTATSITRTEKEIRELIQELGSTPPDWIATTPIEYPPTLDLNWPKPPQKGWNNKKNMGQYIWDRINPNAARWRSGIRLMFHLQTLHENKPTLLRRVNESLASMYFRFFQDYARAAFWWQKLGVRSGSRDAVGLAECYYRLGNKAMAMDMLGGRSTSVGKIKLLGEMGEVTVSLRLADQLGPRSSHPHEIYLTAGDICRLNNRFEDAIDYYKKVLSAPPARNESYSKRYRGRATDSIEGIKRFELLNISSLKDGVYQGFSLGYEAPIHIETAVKSGRIESVKITQHREKQYYSAIRDVPQQIIAKQSVKDIDATSRATITAVAIINATAKALTDRPIPR